MEQKIQIIKIPEKLVLVYAKKILQAIVVKKRVHL